MGHEWLTLFGSLCEYIAHDSLNMIPRVGRSLRGPHHAPAATPLSSASMPATLGTAGATGAPATFIHALTALRVVMRWRLRV